MSVTSRGSPPNSTAVYVPLDKVAKKDLSARFGKLTTRPLLMEQLTGERGKMRNADEAREYLEGSEWIAKGSVFTRDTLFSILLKISLLPQVQQKSMTLTLRALTFMGEVIDVTVADEVGAAVGEAVSPIVGEVVENQRELDAAVKELATVSFSAQAEAAGARVEIATLASKIGELQTLMTAMQEDAVETAIGVRAARVQLVGLRSVAETAGDSAAVAGAAAVLMEGQVESLRSAVAAASEAAATAATETKEVVTAAVAETRPVAGTVPTGPRSYASATAATGTGTMTAAQASVQAREARLRCQILIDKAADATVGSLSTLSEIELKVKANLALTIMAMKLEGADFVGAKKLANGGVVFHCKDEKMASWVKGTEAMVQFLAVLGGTCVFKPRRIELVVERLPVATQIDDGGVWRMAEKDSGLADGAIRGVQWQKAQGRCAPMQRFAHVRMIFATAEAANHAIDHGVWVSSVNYFVKKNKEDAKRCAKCQRYDGHMAHACRATEDTCGRCAGRHRTSDCSVTDAGPFACANCRVNGHAAVDRACPEFLKEQQKRRVRDPTIDYRYFPTSDPRTWATEASAAAMETGTDLMGQTG
ncbi:hypothetical protein C8F04DRAFT_1256745 [Mycena alexandri]|uniref:Uncharacterized protein n=1 Tax=Mycena alexandri TaxID=1745969 RepID=A0AAD6X7J3_9AGAR|nr:hypothetical protein C8F04DRAFT_1256745 [Mycena alexandri]